jgi:DNA-binding NarL/FixJ family response regulator
VLRILLVEHDVHLSSLLAWLVREDRRFELAGIVATGDQAASWSDRLDVAIVDLSIPGLDALSTVRALQQLHPTITILVLSTVDVPYLRAVFADVGAAYADRTTDPSCLLDKLAELVLVSRTN